MQHKAEFDHGKNELMHLVTHSLTIQQEFANVLFNKKTR